MIFFTIFGGRILLIVSCTLGNSIKFFFCKIFFRTNINSCNLDHRKLGSVVRAMDFMVELLRTVVANPEWSMTHACTISYNKTLKRWHGWLTSSSFMVNHFLLGFK